MLVGWSFLRCSSSASPSTHLLPQFSRLQMISGMGRGGSVKLCRPSHAAADVFVSRDLESIGRGPRDSNAGVGETGRIISKDAVFKRAGKNSQQHDCTAWIGIIQTETCSLAAGLETLKGSSDSIYCTQTRTDPLIRILRVIQDP